MNSQKTHIVSRCIWRTSFNDKEKGGALQNEISHWSTHFMPDEIDTVFDSVCPKDHSLKIKRLTLDLGELSYENLQEELTEKLQVILLEQLRDIILNPNKYKQDVEILKGEEVWIDVLEHFLLQGLMPWNSSKKESNINKIFKEQLQENREEIVRLVKKVARKEYVRKRIAWQLNESNVQQLIRSIEKSNHTYVIEFAEELSRIQKEEMIVKTGIHDFKKNLWFWILNYLFVDRGTMFNKVEFVRSNIQQMANHFNIEYNVLFALVESAVYKLYEQSYINANFITILGILSQKQSKNTKFKFSNKEQIAKGWTTLDYYLKSAKNRATSSDKERFIELVNILSIINPSKFKSLINAQQNNIVKWTSISKDLGSSNFQTLFDLMSPDIGEKVLEALTNIKKLRFLDKYHLEQDWLLGVGFTFLQDQEGKGFSNKKFLDYFIKSIANYKGRRKTVILKDIINIDGNTMQVTIKSISLFKNIKELYQYETIKEQAQFSEEQLNLILKELKEELVFPKNNSVIESYHKIIRSWIKKDTLEVWKTLKNYQDKEYVLQLIPVLFNSHELRGILIEKVLSREIKFIKTLENSINSVLSAKKERTVVLQSFKEQMFLQGVQSLLFKEHQNSSTFLKKMLTQVATIHSINNQLIFKEGIEEILLHFEKENYGITGYQKKELLAYVYSYSNSNSIDFLVKYIAENKLEQTKVAKMLIELVNSKEIFQEKHKQQAKKIRNYLLQNGEKVQKEFYENVVKKYSGLIKIYTPQNLQQKTKELFWKCLVDYERYRGNSTQFLSLLENSIKQYLNAKQQLITEKIPLELGSEERKKLLSSKAPNALLNLEIDELLSLVQEAIYKRTTKITVNKQKIEFHKLLLIALENTPEKVGKLFKELSYSVAELTFLQNTFSVQQFIALLLIGEDHTNSLVAYQAILSIDKIILSIKVSTKIKEGVQVKCWESIIQLIKGKRSVIQVLDDLVQFTLEELYKKEEATVSTILSTATRNHIEVPELLKKILVTQNSSFRFLIAQKATVLKKSSLLKEYTEEKSLTKLARVLLVENKIPNWFLHTTSISVKELSKALLREHPLIFLKVIRSDKALISKLSNSIDFYELIEILVKIYPDKYRPLKQIEKLYHATKHIRFNSIATKEIQDIIFHKLLKAWIGANWKVLNEGTIWKELLWETTIKKSIKETLFFEAYDTVKIQLPNALQLSYEALKKKQIHTNQNNLKAMSNIKSKAFNNREELNTGITVFNAGIVKLNSYYPMLFERLGLIENNQFISEEARQKAVHYLQYLTTGQSYTEESFLTMNKLLCGMKISDPVIDGIEISDEAKNTIEGMVHSAISYWSAIGRCSIEGFRGNWLVREGVLIEEEDRWNLTVEKRPYDVLLMKSPFSHSIIKFPWMEKQLNVDWSF